MDGSNYLRSERCSWGMNKNSAKKNSLVWSKKTYDSVLLEEDKNVFEAAKMVSWIKTIFSALALAQKAVASAIVVCAEIQIKREGGVS